MKVEEELDYLRERSDEYESFINLQNDIIKMLQYEMECTYGHLKKRINVLKKKDKEEYKEIIDFMKNICEMKRDYDVTIWSYIKEFEEADYYCSKFE